MKKVVYVASPYTKGDPGINTHFQCAVFDLLMDDGLCTPIVPLWAHFQHLIFPRPYTDWVQYDLEIAALADCCLRLNAEMKSIGYHQGESWGADNEVAFFEQQNKPVFYSIEDLNAWLKSKC